MRLLSGRSKLILLVVCGLVALSGGVAAGLLIGQRARAAKHVAKKKPAPAEPGTIYSLGELVVNLADTGSMRYAKLTVALGVEEKLPEEGLKDQEPALRDAIVGVLTRKRFDELHSREGLPKLKTELRAALK